ncbi:MAG: ParA family protein [Thermosynechococcaceae cyanobacterium]
MIITTASFKGGVGKTTTAIHLAAYLQRLGATALVDCDPNRSALMWAKCSEGMPFKVISEHQAIKEIKRYQHIVIDTQARPDNEIMQELVDGCDLLILPTTPDALALRPVLQTAKLLQSLRSSHYKVLITRVPPPPQKEGDLAQEMLEEVGLPVFEARIREFKAYQKAALLGKLVNNVGDRKGGIGWSDYVALGKEILDGKAEL